MDRKTENLRSLDQRKEDSAMMNIISHLLKTPISFYGKVVDEKRNPIEGVDVKISPTDQWEPYARSNYYSCTNDKAGRFSIMEIHGLNLYVGVSKSGYYKVSLSDKQLGSSALVPYAGVRAYTDPPIPTPKKSSCFHAA